MKNFIKVNWFKIAIVLILLGGLLGFYFGYFLPERKQMALLGLQQKCSEEAQKFFTTGDRYKDGDGILFDYKNHFNSKLNKCFILISASSMATNDFLSLDLYDALEIKHYASYIGHGACNTVALSITGQSNKCQMDSGQIWYDGNDSKNPADFTVGFKGLLNGGGVGDENTQKEFLDHIQTFMND